MPTYQKADDILPDVEVAMEKYRPDLVEAGVTIEVLTAHGDAPALKHHGYPAAAIIRAMPQKDRAAGSADVRLVINAGWWEEASKRQREALLDHELTHLELQRDENGTVKTDDCGRPKIKIRSHDFQVGGFEEVVKRHKADAPESRTFYDAHKVFTQQAFPWGMT